MSIRICGKFQTEKDTHVIILASQSKHITIDKSNKHQLKQTTKQKITNIHHVINISFAIRTSVVVVTPLTLRDVINQRTFRLQMSIEIVLKIKF